MDQTEKRATSPEQPRVLVIYYSFSGQTGGLLNRLTAGLKETGVEVVAERLYPEPPLRFPLNSIPRTLVMMLTTFLRCRVPIQPLANSCRERFDLVILAGPTWSYNPSGPVLSFLDRDGELLSGQVVLSIISCRGYWRLHWYGLRRRLRRLGAVVLSPFVFDHPQPEPWRTLGVFLKIAGRAPERGRFLGRYYQRFGHSKEQQERAWQLGRQLGEHLRGSASAKDFTAAD